METYETRLVPVAGSRLLWCFQHHLNCATAEIKCQHVQTKDFVMTVEREKIENNRKYSDAAFQANHQLGTEQVKILITLNAGAIVVLLAFLQAILPPENETPREFISQIPLGMIA